MSDTPGQMAPEETPLYSFMPNGSAMNMVTVFKDCIEMRVDGRVIRKPIAGWCEAVMSLSDAAKWVPVSERTPDAQYDVLVTDGEIVGIGDCCKGHLWNSPTIDGPVTHWMPLPEAPK